MTDKCFIISCCDLCPPGNNLDQSAKICPLSLQQSLDYIIGTPNILKVCHLSPESVKI